MFVLVVFITMSTFMLMGIMLFYPPAVAWLQSRDDAIRSKPCPEYFRDGFLQKFFYPTTRKTTLSKADSFMIWVVLLAVLAVFYELGVQAGLLPADEAMITRATIMFLVIFSVEFTLRIAMKGFSYMMPWGMIDLLVIIIDLLIIAVHFGWLTEIAVHFGFEGEPPAAAALLRLLRVARLFRALKLVRYAFDRQRRILFWRRMKPHVKALTKLTFIVAMIAATFGGIVSILRGQSPVQGWSQIFSQVWKSLGNSSGSDPFALAASVLILAALANMIAIFYAPIMNKIREEQEKTENLDLMESHVLILLNDREKFGGFVEELLHVFRNSAGKEVFLLHEGGDALGFKNEPRLTLIDGPMIDPSTWRSCAAQNAEIVILLGKHDVLKDQDYLNFINPGGKAPKSNSIIIELHDHSSSYERSTLREGIEKIKLSLPNLITKIGKNAWSRRSLQYAYLHKLTDEFEDVLEFPDLSHFAGSEDAAKRLKDMLSARTNLSIDLRGHNLLVDLTQHEDQKSDLPAELAEVRSIETIIEVLRSDPSNAASTCVFAYVAAFELIGRNSDLAEETDAHLSVFAVEFAAALALFHETIAPGVIKGWLTDLEHTKNGSTFPDTEFLQISSRQRLMSPKMLQSRLSLEPNQTVLALASNDQSVVATTRSTNRFQKNRATHVIVRRSGGAIDPKILSKMQERQC